MNFGVACTTQRYGIVMNNGMSITSIVILVSFIAQLTSRMQAQPARPRRARSAVFYYASLRGGRSAIVWR
jgi:hypothetical protein